MGGHESDDPLALDSQTMRELGYRTVDLLVERLERERGGRRLRSGKAGAPLKRVLRLDIRRAGHAGSAAGANCGR